MHLAARALDLVLVTCACLPVLPQAHASPLQEPSAPPAPESEPEDLPAALRAGRFWLDFNYRFELVDQDGFEKDAYASTLRSVLGYQSAAWQGFQGLVEFENVSAIGNDLYNSTRNGVTDRPVVADPEGTSVNQALLDYVGIEETTLALGRRELKLDNERHVGNVGWRQKHQSFDALSAHSTRLGDADLYYAYVDRVNQVNRNVADCDTHLVNLAYELEGLGRLTAYGYYFDFEDQPERSAFTIGGRLAGRRSLGGSASLLYEAEAAGQSDVADNPLERSAEYYWLTLGTALDRLTITATAELIGGDGDAGSAFQFPLGTLHAFNGWADKFLVTPDGGLQDYFLRASSPWGKAQLAAAVHDFQADSGGAHYGSELDFQATYELRVDTTLGFKIGQYWADEFDADTLKAWLWLRFRV